MKTILVDAWNTFVTKDGVNHAMKAVLDSYPNPKIIVTNADRNELVSFGIVNMPYPVFSLSHKPNKTNPDYFKTLLSEYNLSANNIIYFEHNEDAVNSAKSLSIESLLFKPGSSLNELKAFLDSKL